MKNTNKVNVKEIVGTIEVSKRIDGKEIVMKDDKFYLPTEKIDQDAAFVSVKAGATVNLGSYNSGRIDVSLMYPCYPSQIDDVYESVKNWVDEKLSAEYEELKQAAPKKVDI
jgi:hypothetical protein